MSEEACTPQGWEYVNDAPTSVKPYENTINTDQKPVSICTDEPHVIHQWTEPLTLRLDNYAHFISEDCEPTNSIAKFLVAAECLDLQKLWGCRLKKGQVLVTPHGRHKTYSIVIKRRHVDDVDWKDVTQGLSNLRTAVEKDNRTTCRMENSGDLLGSLPQNKMTELVSEIFQGGNITITLLRKYRSCARRNPIQNYCRISWQPYRWPWGHYQNLPPYQTAIHMAWFTGRNQWV